LLRNCENNSMKKLHPDFIEFLRLMKKNKIAAGRAKDIAD